jgi:hypothetical protein
MTHDPRLADFPISYKARRLAPLAGTPGPTRHQGAGCRARGYEDSSYHSTAPGPGPGRLAGHDRLFG